MLFPFCKFFKILREKSEVCGEKILFDSERIIINTPHDKKEIGCGLDFLREKIISLSTSCLGINLMVCKSYSGNCENINSENPVSILKNSLILMKRFWNKLFKNDSLKCLKNILDSYLWYPLPFSISLHLYICSNRSKKASEWGNVIAPKDISKSTISFKAL